MVDWKALKSFGVPLVGGAVLAYAFYEASDKYPEYLALGSGAVTGLVLHTRLRS